MIFDARLANLLKRLECVQLAGAFGPPTVLESGSKLSKLHALQTLRAIHSAGLPFWPTFGDGNAAGPVTGQPPLGEFLSPMHQKS